MLLAMLVYFGTYTQTTSRGIYAARFDPETGALSDPFLAAEADNPTFLELAPGGRYLYSTCTLRSDPPVKPPPGGASAFAVDPASGRLKFLNSQPTGGGGTTHIAVDRTGRMALVANYAAGYVCSLPIEPDGRLGPRASYFEDKGRAPLGPNPDRQKQAYAHSVTVSPDNRFAFVCDLGLDRVFRYRIDPGRGTMEPVDPPAAVPPGKGARHSKFSPDGRFFYVATEMGSTACAFEYAAADGSLRLVQTISTLPAGYSGPTNTVAEIRIHPSGKFVYVSNRGHESIAVFARDAAKGTLKLVEIVPCGGKHPRNFNLDPSGRWLLCANRDTDNVVVFRVDAQTGRLTPTGREIRMGQPVCVAFLEP
jgi:6-phosphogluconolactonase